MDPDFIEHRTLPLTGELNFDHAHAEIECLIGELAQAHDDAVAATLERLQQHLAAHFADEDRELHRLGEEAHRCHLDEHGAVLASLCEVAEAVSSGNFSVARRLARALRHWLPGHVDQMDLHLARALFARRTGGARIQIQRRTEVAV
jgi:hemerythrin